MKNLLTTNLLFFICFSFHTLKAQEHFKQVIGKMEHGKPTLTVEKKAILEKWETFINTRSKLNLRFDKLSIENSDSGYYLIARDTRANAVSAIALVVDNDIIYEKKDKKETVTVTCSGCTSTGSNSSQECIPLKGENGWYCSSCSSGTCEKTVTKDYLSPIFEKL